MDECVFPKMGVLSTLQFVAVKKNISPPPSRRPLRTTATYLVNGGGCLFRLDSDDLRRLLKTSPEEPDGKRVGPMGALSSSYQEKGEEGGD